MPHAIPHARRKNALSLRSMRKGIGGRKKVLKNMRLERLVRVQAANLARTDGALEVTSRRRVVKLGEGGVFDVAPDARHFLMLQRSDAQVRLEVITNWIPRLRAQLAGTR